jgi:hypothetical protein
VRGGIDWDSARGDRLGALLVSAGALALVLVVVAVIVG